MTDITPDFNICLKQKGAEPVIKKEFDIRKINSFLEEAYSINSRIQELTRYLRSIRASYLSNVGPSRKRQITGDSTDRSVPLSDKEREDIDAQAKQLLRQLHNGIAELRKVEEIRIQSEDAVALKKRAQSGWMRWAGGGAETAKSPDEEQDEENRKEFAKMRNGIIIFLEQRLEEASKVQTEMMGVRLSRNIEKTKSVLAMSPVTGGVPHAYDEDDAAPSSAKRKRFSGGMQNGGVDEPSRQELTQEQIQMFAEENHELLKHYEDQLDKVRTAERSILEISELHSSLQSNLAQQSESIDQLVQDSYLTTENLGKGNKELKRASERRSTAQAVFYSTVAFCSFLVVWDLVF